MQIRTLVIYLHEFHSFFTAPRFAICSCRNKNKSERLREPIPSKRPMCGKLYHTKAKQLPKVKRPFNGWTMSITVIWVSGPKGLVRRVALLELVQAFRKPKGRSFGHQAVCLQMGLWGSSPSHLFLLISSSWYKCFTLVCYLFTAPKQPLILVWNLWNCEVKSPFFFIGSSPQTFCYSSEELIKYKKFILKASSFSL